MATRQRKQNGPIRYAIYTRCSSEDQAEKEYSTLDAQKQINEQYVREKRGTLVKSYSDEGKSGTNLKRPGLQALLRDAEQKMFDVVVVTFMNRLGRGKAFTVAEYLLAQCDVAVETVKEAFADDMGGHVSREATVFTDGILCKQVSMHTRAKQEQMVTSGFFCGGQPPLGYQKQVVEGYNVSGKEPPKRLVIDAREAEMVRHCFNLFLDRQKIAAARDYLKTVTGRFWDTCHRR